VDLKEAVLARVDLAELAGQYTALTRAGREWRGRCPFHQEKTASFYVNPDKGVYHCHGCKAGGNAIGLVMALENLEFRDALEWLANRYNIVIPREQQEGAARQRGEKERLFAANESAQAFFRRALASPAGEPARAYLERRGVDSRLAADFDLGYAPREWSALTDKLLGEGLKSADLVKLGLIRQRSGEAWAGQSNFIDVFRHRLIFPIRNVTGRIIAFAGRALADEDTPKYLNVAATPLYDKGATLYNLDKAKGQARDQGLVIVEGYMDVIGLARAGVGNAVASCGTALTEQHVRMSARYTDRFYLCLDSDEAGRRAAWGAGLLYLRAGYDPRVIRLGSGKDPDEFMRNSGDRALAAWEAARESSVSVVRYWLEHQIDTHPDADLATQRAWIVQLAGLYQSLPDNLIRQEFTQEVSGAMRLGAAEVSGLLAAGARPAARPGQAQGSSLRQETQRRALLQGSAPIEREAVRRLLTDEQFRFYFGQIGQAEWFESEPYRAIWRALAADQSPDSLIHGEDLELGTHLSELLAAEALKDDNDALLARMNNQYLQRRIDALMAQYSEAERSKDEERMLALMSELLSLKQQFRQIRGLETVR
jgi:DNA primase